MNAPRTAQDYAPKELDAACNAGFRKLDELKKQGKDGTPEYMQALYSLRDLTRARILARPVLRNGYNASQADYDNILTALERLYAAFPDCDGGEQGKACQLARLAISAANEGR